MSTQTSSSANPKPGWNPPVIRQVAIVMLVLCLAVPAALYLRGQHATKGDHEPAKTKEAMTALFAAIEPASEKTLPPTTAMLGELLPTCAKLAPHQGLPIMDDIEEQLSKLDGELAQLTAVEGVHNAPLRKRYQLNTVVWAKWIKDGAFGCAHAVHALRILASPRGATLLANAKWQENARHLADGKTFSTGSPQSLLQTFAVQMAPKSLAQIDPWRGWPGCILIGGLQTGSAAYYVSPGGRATWGKLLCEQEGIRPKEAKTFAAAQPTLPGTTPAKDSSAWAIPIDLGLLLAELEPLRLPEGKLYNDYAATMQGGANRRVVGRNEVDVGFNVQLTIDPRTQSIAQQVAECYTGNVAACGLVGIDFNKVGAAEKGPGAKAMWEQAAARMTAVAVIDVATGRIEALASAHTPCYAQENDGPFRDAGCAPLWTKPKRRPDALRNHAVFADYMPGSTVKPIMASVFFEDERTDKKQLELWLAKSNSDRFNDELFCLNSPKGQLCDRPARVQQRAAHLGWNVDCTDQASFRCAKADMLFGRRLSARLEQDDSLPVTNDDNPIQRTALAGRMFVEPAATVRGNAYKLMSIPATDPKSAINCRDNEGEWHATNCKSGALKALVNEAFGQGQAKATTLGVATMLARLAAAARGVETVRRPYLVEVITDANGKPVATAATRNEDGSAAARIQPEPTQVRPEVAKKVFSALALGTTELPGQDGTGHLICKHVFGAECATVGKQIAGKTGTPSYPLDAFTIQIAKENCLAKPKPGQNKQTGCDLAPVKWYVAAYKTSASDNANYDKVIAVMSERNWYLASKDLPKGLQGRIHGVNDLNNISTEIAMRALGAGLLNPGGK